MQDVRAFPLSDAVLNGGFMMAITVQALIDALNLNVFHLCDPDRCVSGGYCGDLLSWVMSRAQENNVWLTIMSNVNVAAVASLCEVSCVILTEDVCPDAALMAKAEAQGINLLGTSRTTLDTAVALSALLG